MLSIVFLFGFTLIPVGYLCLVASDSGFIQTTFYVTQFNKQTILVKEWKYEYTKCSRLGSACELNVNLSEDFQVRPFFHYYLSTTKIINDYRETFIFIMAFQTTIKILVDINLIGILISC